MRRAAAGFALGVLALQYRPHLPGAGAWLLLVLAAGGLAWTAWAMRASVRRVHFAGCARFALALLAGFAWAALFAQWRLGDALSPELEGRDLVVAGVVAALPQPFERGLRFEFEVESAQLPAGLAGAQVPQRIQLAWYRVPESDESADAPPLRPGERWRFTVRLRRPHGSANPRGFDYEAWLLERGIRATGYVRPGPRARLDDFVLRPDYAVERLREGVRERFRRVLPDAPYAGVLVALAIGDQRAISAADWEVFARTGVSHLMSMRRTGCRVQSRRSSINERVIVNQDAGQDGLQQPV